MTEYSFRENNSVTSIFLFLFFFFFFFFFFFNSFLDGGKFLKEFARKEAFFFL